MKKLTKEEFTWFMKIIGAILSLVHLLENKGILNKEDIKKYHKIVEQISNDLDCEV